VFTKSSFRYSELQTSKNLWINGLTNKPNYLLMTRDSIPINLSLFFLNDETTNVGDNRKNLWLTIWSSLQQFPHASVAVINQR